jgi:gliding motility-associated lipoprotein GldH
MNQQMIKYSFIASLLFVFACNSNSIYHQKNELENQTWSYNNAMLFKWTVKDTADWYRMMLKIDHASNLNYRNLYVKCLTLFPDHSQKEQILSLELFDETGKPFGKCSGSGCTTEISLLPKTKFQFQGDYELSIIQYGRDSIVKGLNNFELDISKIKID